MRLPKPLRQAGSIVGIAAMLAGTTLLVYVTGGANPVALEFYYIPIIISAFLFETLGALVCAVVAGILAGPYRAFLSGQSFEGNGVEWLVRFLFFAVIGMIAARLSVTVVRQAREFQSLFHVAQAINSSLHVDRVLRRIATYARRILNARAVSIRLLDPETGELTLAASEGLSAPYLDKGKVDLGGSEIDRQVASGSTVAIENVDRTDLLQYADRVKQEGVFALLCVPMKAKDRVLGVFRGYWARPKRFSSAERGLAQTFANQAAIAIENAELYETLQTSYFQTVRSLARALEALDEATVGHSERVTQLVGLVAEGLGMKREEIAALRFGAILHDIGKLGSAKALVDPDLLEGDGGDVIARMHPLMGATILEPVAFLKPALPVVLFHHEYLDGSGYPQGSQGDEIPLVGRIAAAVNDFDNIVSRAAGNPAAAISFARERLGQMAGTKLDADVVRVLLEVTEGMTELPTETTGLVGLDDGEDEAPG